MRLIRADMPKGIYVAAGDLNAPRRFPTLETGQEEMILCDAIAVSVRERRWVQVKQR